MFRRSADAAWRDGSKKQLGAESAAGEVGGDGFSCRLSREVWVEEDNDRWTGATEGYAENAWFSG
jgi:hypothetical protein